MNCDWNGAVPVATALYSLLKAANPGIPLEIHVIHDAKYMSEGGAGKARDVVKKFPFASVAFHDFTPYTDKYGDLLRDNPPRWPAETWGWCFCAELMPETTGNVVFIDWDTFVFKDLEELYSLDLESGGFVAAAVDEAARSERPDLEKAGWSKAAGNSVNTGVIVIDIDAFRREKVLDRILDWHRRHKSRTMCIEQDAFNVTFGERIKRIHPRWNFFVGWAERPIRMNPFRKVWRVNPPARIVEAAVDPGIVHFISGRKPWVYTHTPFRNRYRRALIELGFIKHDLPGERGFKKWVEGPFFDLYHWLIGVYCRMLLATLFRSR